MKKLTEKILILILTISLISSFGTVAFAAQGTLNAPDIVRSGAGLEDEEYEDEESEDEESEDEGSEDEESESEEEETKTDYSNLEYGKWPEAPETISGSVYMLEANTGAVFYSKDIDKKRYPASTTKILTCLIALENCSMNEKVTFSARAVDIEDGATSIGAVAGEEMLMKDVLYGLMLPSGNDCANAIAEHIAGSIEAFCDMMNERAAELGCTDTNFSNPSGLYGSDHYTTAQDLMLIAQAAFNNSAFVDIVSQSSYTIAPTNMTDESRYIESTNSMVVKDSAYYNEYVVGGKTGYLPESGRCLVTMAKKDGLSIITVCMFSSLYNGVFSDTLELLDYAFGSFSLVNVGETEGRFTYASNDAKIYLDQSSQILMPSSVTTLDELESKIEFAYDLDIDEFREASTEAGITTQDGRHLYATIKYSYGDYYLGSINAIIDDNMEITTPTFKTMIYISPWIVVAIVVVVIIILIAIIRMIIIQRKKAEQARRRARRRPVRR